jgi:EpsI family protein
MQFVWKSKYLRILTLILLAQATLFYSTSHGDSRPLQKPLSEFPEQIPGFQLIRHGVIEQETKDILHADDLLSSFYVHSPIPDPTHITPERAAALVASADELFVAYFSSQQTGQSPHSPKNCLPGSGWQPVDTGELTVPIAGTPGITINKYVIVKGASQSLVLYWYQSHGRVVANEFSAKFYLVADSLRYHRSDTALVRVVVPVLHDDLAASLDSATHFVQSVYPLIYQFLPQ